jgi:hypothetical protein
VPFSSRPKGARIKVLKHRIRYEISDEFRIYFITDPHIGSFFCDEDLLKADVKKIAEDPNAYWIGGGDYAEFINRSDKRHRESTLAPWLHGKDDISELQIKRIAKIVEPIRDKCLGLCKGNHEDFILDRYERDVYAHIVEMTTSPDRQIRLGWGGFVVIFWDDGSKARWKTTIFAHHGSGGGLLPGGHALTLGRLPTWYDFDIAMLGHRHIKQWVPNTKTRPSARGDHLEQQEQHMFFGGTYHKSVDLEKGDIESYAEGKLLPPKAVGGVVTKIHPHNQEYKIIV